MDWQQLEARLLACEMENHRLRTSMRRQLALGVAALGLLLVGATVAADRVTRFERVEAEEFVVRDARGIVRVRLSGDLPDAVIDGKALPRGQAAAGVMLYDTLGQERGGYVTFADGNVALTLDSRKRQAALFAAGPESGVVAEIWQGGQLVGMRIDGQGARFTATRDGKVALQLPEVQIGPEACTAYRDPQLQLGLEARLQACTSRFIEAQCRSCLGAEPPMR